MTDASRARRPFIIYLLGSVGVGKYTVATEISGMTGAVVVDNQLINHPVLSVFNWNGVSKLPKEIWNHIAIIREEVLTVVETLTSHSISYVLTNALEDDSESDILFHRIREIAAARGAIFLPVVLTCDPNEQLRRATSRQRKQRLKISHPGQVEDYVASTTMYIPTDPVLLLLDTTSLTQQETAEVILQRVEELR